jgi:hypothetical protein
MDSGRRIGAAMLTAQLFNVWSASVGFPSLASHYINTINERLVLAILRKCGNILELDQGVWRKGET